MEPTNTFVTMFHYQAFTFNPFQENTYVAWDETSECIIIDPGMSDRDEEKELANFIQDNTLKPVRLLNTHCHIDHILGNAFCADNFSIQLHAHKLELPILQRGINTAVMFGVNYHESPQPEVFLEEGDSIRFGNSILEIMFVPGHSPGHVAFIHRDTKTIFDGDVLFSGSVGRVDLPGCNPSHLVDSIQRKLYLLPDDFLVLPGHGPSTTIGQEKQFNAFVRQNDQNLIP